MLAIFDPPPIFTSSDQDDGIFGAFFFSGLGVGLKPFFWFFGFDNKLEKEGGLWPFLYMEYKCLMKSSLFRKSAVLITEEAVLVDGLSSILRRLGRFFESSEAVFLCAKKR